MSFPNDFYLRVIQGLNLSINDASTVQAALATAETDLNVETTVTTTVSALEDICTLLNSERSSPNSALIRADVLEWSEGERSQGMVVRKRELQQQLANLLGLDWSSFSPNYPAGTHVVDTETLLE